MVRRELSKIIAFMRENICPSANSGNFRLSLSQYPSLRFIGIEIADGCRITGLVCVE